MKHFPPSATTPLRDEARVQALVETAGHPGPAVPGAREVAAAVDFVADVSHELRTPLSAIVGLLHLLKTERLPPRALDHIAKLGEVADSMVGLVEGVLDFAKIDSGKMKIEHVEFAPQRVLSSLHAIFDNRAYCRGNQLVFECDPEIPALMLGDPLRLRQVLTNLLGNALKFTEGGAVQLTCRRQPAAPGKVRVEFAVSDNGIGIEPSRIASLFARFEQAEDSTSRRFGGSGLGLSISSQLVRLMGGAIEVESAPGLGTTFRFELDFDLPRPGAPCCCGDAHVPTPPKDAGPMDVRMLRGVRVLVAEDNVIQQFVVSELLRSVGAHVDVVGDGAEALRRINEEPWHIVLMDVEMPVMGGLEATAEVRKSGVHADLPIIAMTAHAGSDARLRAQCAGMNDVVFKPIEPVRLCEVVFRWHTAGLKSHPE